MDRKIVHFVLTFALVTFFLVGFFAEISHAQRSSGSVQPKIWNSPSLETPQPPMTQSPISLKPAQEMETDALNIEVVPEMPTNSVKEPVKPTVPPLEIPKSQEIPVSHAENVPKPTEKVENTEKKSDELSLEMLTAPEGIQNSLTVFLTLSAVSVAPAFVMMTTSFLRIFVVLCILRHGFGTQGIPGTQVLAALALFMTFFLMFPTWQRTWNEAVVPYQEGTLTAENAMEAGLRPLREFMSVQLENTGNTEEILLFWRYSSTPPDKTRLAEYTADDVPTHVLLPAFMLSELKTAFLMGVQLLIPLLVIDLLVSAILVSMGMFMLPPTVVSLPLKLLLFVLADGWRLVVEMLLVSFR
ncbi:MAG: flagellar type III secretion system pore protein FliP [Planctomycetia bacterium]|nr:flagellar type III secretion system pore protein FliP [Planctomycetia bacterium]